MNRDDWRNVMHIIKRAVYDYEIDYFEDESFKRIPMGDSEISSVQKFMVQYGSGVDDQLNDMLYDYLMMKGGNKITDKLKRRSIKGPIKKSTEGVRKTVGTQQAAVKGYVGADVGLDLATRQQIANMSRQLVSKKPGIAFAKQKQLYTLINQMLNYANHTGTVDASYLKDFRALLNKYEAYHKEMQEQQNNNKAIQMFLKNDVLGREAEKIYDVFKDALTNYQNLKETDYNTFKNFKKDNETVEFNKITEIKGAYEEYKGKVKAATKSIITNSKTISDAAKEAAIAAMEQTIQESQQGGTQSPNSPDKPLPESLDVYTDADIGF